MSTLSTRGREEQLQEIRDGHSAEEWRRNVRPKESKKENAHKRREKNAEEQHKRRNEELKRLVELVDTKQKFKQRSKKVEDGLQFVSASGWRGWSTNSRRGNTNLRIFPPKRGGSTWGYRGAREREHHTVLQTWWTREDDTAQKEGLPGCVGIVGHNGSTRDTGKGWK